MLYSMDGIIPFICEGWKNKPLFIIDGSLEARPFLPIISGKAYTYEDFPWPKGVEKLSEKKCRDLAERINKNYRNLWVTSEVSKQFEEIIQKIEKTKQK